MSRSFHRYIFLLARKSGDILVLHPFRPGDDIFRTTGNLVLEGRYGAEPDPVRLDSLRSALHSDLEKGARRDALERGFYPRLFASAGVFLLLYLFLSIVVRDPLPMVDELLVGTLGALASWFALERKALSSEAFTERTAALRKTLDSALFRSSRAARVLEELLQDAETLEPGRYAEFLACSPEFRATEEELRELAALMDALETRLPAEAVQDVRRLVSGAADSAALARRVKRQKRVDIPILLSYARIQTLLEAAV